MDVKPQACIPFNPGSNGMQAEAMPWRPRVIEALAVAGSLAETRNLWRRVEASDTFTPIGLGTGDRLTGQPVPTTPWDALSEACRPLSALNPFDQEAPAPACNASDLAPNA